MQDLEAWQDEAPRCSGDAGLASVTGERLERVRSAAAGAADALLLTDAPLLHPPGQLALAALRFSLRKVSLSDGYYPDPAVNLSIWGEKALNHNCPA